MGPVFVVTSRITNEVRVQKPRVNANDPVGYDVKTVYTIGLNLIPPDSTEPVGPGVAFQSDTLDKYSIGAKFTLEPAD